ncbi:hypothetical protein J7T55_006984 [Diaporthe amygdali]|uniref:uncharacterized protein n=1 Tax=Phomopsis amygdali TaxID=1214568 RepID=UPI0022FDD858|nr:uncharacterized protein J7T55_006984 [Diaporthe amygdali]KAJ0104058.1 hypothetical protein J7T55_006984 [Diaporthe amygdali]
MDYSRDNDSTAGLIRTCTMATTEDDATTIYGNDRQTTNETQRARFKMLEHSDCGGLSSQSRELQTTKTIYESWTLTYHRPEMHVKAEFRCFCVFPIFLKTFSTIRGRVVSIAPKTQFEQEELAEVVSCVRNQYKRRLFSSSNYDKDVEARLRKLDWTVQDELYKLIQDRTGNASNTFRRRDYKLVVLLEVPGGEMTDAGTGTQCNKRWPRMLRKLKGTKAPHVEYRVIFRGTEIINNDVGWSDYDRYTQPSKLVDEAELANAREKSGYQELLG